MIVFYNIICSDNINIVLRLNTTILQFLIIQPIIKYYIILYMPCSLCGTPGTNSSTCPKNPGALRPNYQAHGGGYNDDECPICLEPFKWTGLEENPKTKGMTKQQLEELADLHDTTKVVEIVCGHVFHKECITKEARTSTLCPLCKTPIRLRDAAPIDPARHRYQQFVLRRERRQASERARKQASERARQQASERARQQASERARQQQASERARQQASERARQQRAIERDEMDRERLLRPFVLTMNVMEEYAEANLSQDWSSETPNIIYLYVNGTSSARAYGDTSERAVDKQSLYRLLGFSSHVGLTEHMIAIKGMYINTIRQYPGDRHHYSEASYEELRSLMLPHGLHNLRYFELMGLMGSAPDEQHIAVARSWPYLKIMDLNNENMDFDNAVQMSDIRDMTPQPTGQDPVMQPGTILNLRDGRSAILNVVTYQYTRHFSTSIGMIPRTNIASYIAVL
jgi:hypothetical protein